MSRVSPGDMIEVVGLRVLWSVPSYIDRVPGDARSVGDACHGDVVTVIARVDDSLLVLVVPTIAGHPGGVGWLAAGCVGGDGLGVRIVR